MLQGINVDIHEVEVTDCKIMEMAEHAEKFDPRTEALFRYLQVGPNPPFSQIDVTCLIPTAAIVSPITFTSWSMCTEDCEPWMESQVCGLRAFRCSLPWLCLSPTAPTTLPTPWGPSLLYTLSTRPVPWPKTAESLSGFLFSVRWSCGPCRQNWWCCQSSHRI